MWKSLILVVISLFGFCEVCRCDELLVLNVPSGVRLSSSRDATLLDVQALPYQLFGLDESQSRILLDVSFFRRPNLLAVVALTCGGSAGAAACADAVADASTAPRRIRLDAAGAASDPLLFRPAGGLTEKSLLASTASLPDSSHPALFVGLDLPGADRLPAALPDESGLPGDLVRQMRLAQAAVDRAVASGLLTDSQPDALQVDVSVGGDATPAVRRRVAQFAVGLADKLAAASGRDRAFVAVVVADAPPPALVRVGRSLMAAADASSSAAPTTPAPSGGMNLATDYNQDFPVMFNIILWLSVVLILAVYAVAYGLWNVDPGKDSIIYRRGYAHAKKD